MMRLCLLVWEADDRGNKPSSERSTHEKRAKELEESNCYSGIESLS
jgi:hypothetical protein